MPRVFVLEDYEKWLDAMLKERPLEEAMSLAVGGSYDAIGEREAELLTSVGLRNGMSVLDLGCGSGRCASQLGKKLPAVNYIGIDILQRLLDYAATKCPSHFRFICHHGVDIPLSDRTIDVAAAFSLFTHLQHEETFCYLQELRRVLKPNGILVASFLEFAREDHWSEFEAIVTARKLNAGTPLNMFIEEAVLRLWAAKIGFTIERIDRADPIGQTVAFLQVR